MKNNFDGEKDRKMEDKKYALLIDAENIGSQYFKIIIDELNNDGIVTYKRIYGDWSQNTLRPWKDVLLQNGITPMQQYSYTQGKNATDSAMIIDAMDILYSGKVDGFCLVSSDSDFTKLAMRLREAGMNVIGMGKKQTPKAFVAACSTFKYIDLISGVNDKEKVYENSSQEEKNRVLEQKGGETSPEEPAQTSLNEICDTINKILEDNGDRDGWVLVSTIGSLLQKKYPEFDARNYKFKKLVQLLENQGFEVRYDRVGSVGMVAYVRKKKPVVSVKEKEKTEKGQKGKTGAKAATPKKQQKQQKPGNKSKNAKKTQSTKKA